MAGGDSRWIDRSQGRGGGRLERHRPEQEGPIYRSHALEEKESLVHSRHVVSGTRISLFIVVWSIELINIPFGYSAVHVGESTIVRNTRKQNKNKVRPNLLGHSRLLHEARERLGVLVVALGLGLDLARQTQSRGIYRQTGCTHEATSARRSGKTREIL